MLISHRYRFIYTKTVKTGSTSVESYFERFCMPAGTWTQSHAREEYESESGIIGFRGPNAPTDLKWKNHMSAALIRDRIGEDIWNDYLKFCVIRNPYEKCISAYEHFGRRFAAPVPETRPLLSSEESDGAPMNQEQLHFLHYIRSNPPIDRNKYTINGAFCLDEVIRHEQLADDVQRICALLGMPYESQYLPNFKAGIRRPEATVESLYTEWSREEVRNRFAYELEFFGYGFPGSETAAAGASLRTGRGRSGGLERNRAAAGPGSPPP